MKELRSASRTLCARYGIAWDEEACGMRTGELSAVALAALVAARRLAQAEANGAFILSSIVTWSEFGRASLPDALSHLQCFT